MSNALPITPYYVAVPSHRRLWTPEEDARLLEMSAIGMPVKKRARELGRNYSAVVLRLYILNKLQKEQRI